MYYVPDGTDRCGYFMCSACGSKFLSLQTTDSIPCPYCEEDVDLEIGPDEEMSVSMDSAKLQQILEGEDVEKMDIFLSLALTGGNYDWI